MKILFPVFLCIFFPGLLLSQQIVHRDPEIKSMVQQVSADSLHGYIQQLVSFDTRHTLSTQNDPDKGIGAARDWVLGKFQQFTGNANGRMTCIMDTVTLPANGRRINRPVLLGNVMATLKGTDPNDDRIFIISGHLDSRNSDPMDSTGKAPGANDDGSGVAAVIECARVMSTHEFPATIIFVAVSGEEQGLFGSTYLAEKAKKEEWNVVAMLNNDIIGGSSSSGTGIVNNTQLRVFSEGIPHFETEKQIRKIIYMGLENDGASRQLARYIKETGERYVDHMEVMLMYRTDRFLRGGDHLPFLRNGFTAVRLTEMNENYTRQHQDVRKEDGIQYGDLPKFVDYEYLRKNTAVNLASLANMAKSPGQPTEVKMDVSALSNSTSLSWKPPSGKKVKGYFVLMRKTSAPMWEQKFFTEENRMTLPYSKDNYFFAVQSVSATGNESLPVVPEVER